MPTPIDIGGVDAALLKNCRDRVLKDLEVVIRVLQRPIGLQADAAARQALIDHAVGIVVDRRGDLAAIGDIDQQRAPRLSTEIHADCVLATTHVDILLG